ncbi:uncharacterized protein LOC126837120 [Adelges cooleyi]|uniref:uncharacterized protein LOC126837120 n=1 Tax=Adelges cooleyi TaxID=133065 RepID=UPI00217F9EDA|nr:uncharacterized protein LOC126837120 [Adelges cooleyi]
MYKFAIYNSHVIFAVFALVHIAEGCSYFDKLTNACPATLDMFAEKHTADMPNLKPTFVSWLSLKIEASVSSSPDQDLKNNVQKTYEIMVAAFNEITSQEEKKRLAYDAELVEIQNGANKDDKQCIVPLTVELLSCP